METSEHHDLVGQAPRGVPKSCPVTGRPYWGLIEHPDYGLVPTYGGPYNTYTIPHTVEDGDLTALMCENYDHDHGAWSDNDDPTIGYLVEGEPLSASALVVLEKLPEKWRGNAERLRQEAGRMRGAAARQDRDWAGRWELAADELDHALYGEAETTKEGQV